ncbi:response regulator [Muricoccus vinaceus]|uniref:histidine kinase n=1 Tax=Muricoccus vinaceus TaxID=424704 RepID=A0ABV6ITB3_9PROT
MIERIQALEARLQESEDTLDAIRRGEVDALVVGGTAQEHRVFTLESADRPYRVLIEQMQEGAVTLGSDGTVLYCNTRLAEMLRVPQERIIGHPLRPLILQEDCIAFDRLLDEARSGVARRELTLRTAEGVPVPVYMSLSLLHSEDSATLLCGVLTDLTEQKLRLRELSDVNERLVGEIAERERVEDALRQSQKMEAVGQLTGGIAHDFNNLLTGITGSLELLQTRVAQGRIRDVDRYVNAAQGAAKRAAALTHRLLAFSRRQTLDPKPTDVNRLVAGMEELVRRTVGPEISVEPIAGGGLWPTLVDPSQLENALLNLCINARDAMPGGGKLVIETGNRWLDERAARDRELPPGQYVTLCVSDNGTGMPPDVIARAFDPFYTTKPIGMGTGLGLSMIYGFARQSGGQARIYSEVTKGTMVCLYLPRHLGDVAETDVLTELPRAPRAEHNETVLVIDDEPTVRMLVAEILEDLGYTALEASDGTAGLKILQSDVRIDLLVTDVGLPGGMNGRQVADAARVARPGMKVLFITGYAENAVLSHGHLEAGMHVLTKPFAMDVLAARIRELIASSLP